MAEIRRVRIISDPSELVPLLQSLSSQTHRKVFDLLSEGWKSEEELRRILRRSPKESLEILGAAGLLESRWGTPAPGKTPSKEYRLPYSHLKANFECTMSEMQDVVKVMGMSSKEVDSKVRAVLRQIRAGNTSIAAICEALKISRAFLRSLSYRTNKFVVRGQRVEIGKEETAHE